MDVLPSFCKSENHIIGKVKEIREEISINGKLLEMLKSHAEQMMHTLKQVSTPDKFYQIFIEVNSSLFRYMNLLIGINCKVEILLTEEIKKWNDFCEDSNLTFTKSFVSHLEYNENESSSKHSVHQNMTHSNPKHFQSNFSENSYTTTGVERNLAYFGSSQRKEFKVPKISDNNVISVGLKSEDSSTCSNVSTGQESEVNLNAKLDLHNVGSMKDKTAVSVNTPSLEYNVCLSEKDFLQDKKPDTSKTNILEVQKHDCETPESNASLSSEVNKNVTIKEITIAGLPNSKYMGHIKYAASPSELYIYFATSEILLMENCDKELKSLCEYYKLSHTSYHNMDDKPMEFIKKSAMKELGMYALFYSESDDIFHRVKVRNWTREIDNDLVNVFLLDYGTTLNVHLDKLYPMLDHLMEYPAFAKRCHLKGNIGSKPIFGENPINWNKEVLHFLKGWVNANEEIVVVIDVEETKQNVTSLSVTIYNNTETECLNNLISNFETVKSDLEIVSEDLNKTSKEKNESDLSVEKWNPMVEAFESHMNCYDTDIDDPSAAIYGYVGQDYKRVCKFYGETGKCFKGQSCRKEHIELDPKGFTTDKEEVYVNAFSSLEIPSNGGEFYARITNIISVTEFYCVLEDSQVNQKDETLLSLAFYMNKIENISKMKKLAIPPSAGQIVLGKFTADGSWYRARVLEVIPEKDLCTLFYVDYGNTETVTLSNIRDIEPQYLHLPFQAIHCQIDGICNKPDIPLNESIKCFEDILTESVKIRIISTLPGEKTHLLVKLYNSTGEDIGEQLATKNIVMRKDNIFLSESEIFLPG